jgi:predicted nucleic acid-binding Zn ribbon protein
VATVIPNCGTYLIEAYALGTNPANAFKLDISTLDSTDVLAGATWYDISQYIRNVSIFRGRQNVFREASVTPGRASFTIYDPNFYFSVVNTASPYWNATDNRLSIAVSTPVRISRNGEYLFVGQITTYDQNIMQPNYATVNVTCSDEIQVMNNIKLGAQSTIQQSSGDRIKVALDSAGILKGAGERAIANGVCTIGAVPIEDGAALRDYLLRIQNCEYGRMFMSRSGTFTAQPRVQAEITNPLATLSDTGTGIPYQTFDIANS